MAPDCTTRLPAVLRAAIRRDRSANRPPQAPIQERTVSASRRDEAVSGRQQAAGSPVGRPPRGRIDMSAQVAEHLRAATAQLITGACLALAAALIDEHNLQHPIDHLGETFHVNRLHTIFRMLACKDESGRVTIDADGHFRALLQDATAIALEAATERLRGAAAGEQRRQAASELSELRALSLALAPRDRDSPRGGT